MVSLLARGERLGISMDEMEETSHKNAEFEKMIAEKQQLQIQVEDKFSQSKQAEAQKKEAISNYINKIREKDRAIEEEKKKRIELEKRLRAEEQSREKEARDHADELWRHKKAFAELVSSHRQLEAEMGRALKQVGKSRTELEEMFRQREEAMAMAMQLSAEIAKLRRDTVTEENRKDEGEMKQPRIFFLDHLHDDDSISVKGEERRKDEKLEAYRWRLLTMELQTERLQSQVEGLEGKLSTLRKERAELENQLSEREQELKSLRKQVDMQWQYCRQIESSRSPATTSPHPRPLWLELKKEKEEDQRKENTVMGSQTPISFSREFTGRSEKVDLHALALSYKINRLRQQLLSFEKLAGGDTDNGLRQLLPSLHKQARKYRSLEEKGDDLCRRMEREDEGRRRGSSLGSLLEEAFQIQRYVVGTGQRSAELSTRIANCDSPGNGGRFADVIRALLRDIQRCLEVRVARIIGNLEGILAHEGILRSTPRVGGVEKMNANDVP